MRMTTKAGMGTKHLCSGSGYNRQKSDASALGKSLPGVVNLCRNPKFIREKIEPKFLGELTIRKKKHCQFFQKGYSQMCGGSLCVCHRMCAVRWHTSPTARRTASAPWLFPGDRSPRDFFVLTKKPFFNAAPEAGPEKVLKTDTRSGGRNGQGPCKSVRSRKRMTGNFRVGEGIRPPPPLLLQGWHPRPSCIQFL